MATPTPRQTARTSKEAQRNAAISAVYQSLSAATEVSNSGGTQEYWTCASQSEPGARHRIDHDLLADTYHCDCEAGQWGRTCKHILAAKRYVANRAAHIAGQAEMEARMTRELAERDTAILRRNNQPFSLWR